MGEYFVFKLFSSFFYLILAAIRIHSEQRELAEKEIIKSAEREREAASKRRVAPLTPAERAAQVAFKQQQALIWQGKLDAADRDVASTGDTAARERQAHAVARLAQIRSSLSELLEEAKST